MKYEIIDNKCKCLECGKLYSIKGIGTHIWRAHGKGKSFDPNIGYEKGTRTIWNKGLNEDTDDRVKNTNKKIRKMYKEGKLTPSFKGKKHSDKTKKIISEKLSLNNKGGRCKWYDFKKSNGDIIKVQGTWELRFCKVLEGMNVDWIKLGIGDNHHSFKWKDDDDIEHTYTPDFYSKSLDTYFEVKGYWWNEDEIKMKKVINQNSNTNIEMVFKNDLEQYEENVL